MALNPNERQDFVLAGMLAVAAAFEGNAGTLAAMDHAHSQGGPTRLQQAVDMAYEVAVALADKYDVENP